MKIRQIKTATINKSLHNVKYCCDIIINVNRQLTDDDLLEQVPMYKSSTEQSHQADMMIEGIWFPIINQHPDLIDVLGYDVDETKLTFNIYVEYIGRNQFANDFISEIKQVVSKLTECNAVDVVKTDIHGYNTLTDEYFIIKSLEELTT